MREGTGTALLYSIVITIVSIVLLLLVSSVGYSKAFKVNSRIVDIIEKHGTFNERTEAEIGMALSQIGYRISKPTESCPTLESSYGEVTNVYTSVSYNYDYCVYRHKTTANRYYYTVLTYMYFDFPVIGEKLKLRFTNQTKTLGLFEG